MALSDNLVSFWKFEGNSNDSVGANNGTDTNALYSSSYGKISQGLYTNSATGYTTVSGVASTFNGTAAWTVNLWFKSVTWATNNRSQHLFGVNTSGSSYLSYACNLSIQEDGALNWYHGNGTSTENCLSEPWLFIMGKWNMLTVVHDGTRYMAYMNNAKQIGYRMRQYTSTSTNNLATIGASKYSAVTETTDAYIDEVGVWSRALSTTEISQLYNSGNGVSYPLPVTFSVNDTPSLTESVSGARAYNVETGYVSGLKLI